MCTTVPVIAASISSLAACISVWFAFSSRREAKIDEKLVVSGFNHPCLRESSHSQSVIWCCLFNKSKTRKVEVSSVLAFDSKDVPIEITWSKSINDLGTPQDPCELIGIADSENLFIRRNDGKYFNYCKLEIYHSFSSSPYKSTFDEFVKFVDEIR